MNTRLFRRIPGPKGLPILGIVLEFLKNPVSLFRVRRSWASKHKSIYAYKLLNKRIVNLLDPDDVEIVLSRSDMLSKSFVYELGRPWFIDSHAISTGAKWQQRRRLILPTLHVNVLKDFKAIMEKHCLGMLRELDVEADKSKTDISNCMGAYALDAICESALGINLADESDQNQIYDHKAYRSAIIELGRTFTKRMCNFWLWPDFIFKLSPTGRLQSKTLKIAHGFFSNILERKRRSMNENSTGEDKKNLALLDMLLKAEKDGVIDEGGIREEVDFFMFAGHDITAKSLTMALFELANHSEIQEKVYEECVRILGTSDRMATMPELNDMEYLEACIKETLRLYPSVPAISRTMTKDVTLKKFVVPAESICVIQIYDMHRSAALFDNPDEFKPERFLNGEKRHPFAYIPFSAGPRNCMGQKFSMLQLKIAISSVMRRFLLKPVTTLGHLQLVADRMIRTTEPIYVKLVRRTS